MQVKVYMDVLYLINFFVGYVVLRMTARLLNLCIGRWRILLSSAIASLTLLMFVPFGFFYHPLGSLLIYIGISLEADVICFGRKKGILYKWLLSTTIMVLIGSCMNYIRYGLGLTVLGFYKWMLCFFVAEITIGILFLIFKMNHKKYNRLYSVKLTHGMQTVQAELLLDTGNRLWDPLFCKPVLVLSEEVVKSCLTVEENRLLKECSDIGIWNHKNSHSNELQKSCFFHEISYESVGNTNGKMICFLVDKVEIAQEKRILYKQPVAVVPKEIFQKREYQGLLQPDCISI